jgi:tetratricopeptide (TPR) repeat protein
MGQSSLGTEICGTLRELIRQQSLRVAHVADRAGMDRGHVHRLLSGNRPLHLKQIERLLDAIAIPDGVFCDLLTPPDGLSAANASLVLASCRDELPLPRATLLDLVDQRLPSWIEGQRDSVAVVGSRRAKILALEEERFGDRRRVKDVVESLIREILETDRDVGAADDLALALSVWAAIRRIEGSRADARDAYLHAFALVRDAFAEGFVYQKAAWLLADFTRERLGLLFLDQALRCFAIAGADAWQARLFVDRGLIYLGLGDNDAAERWLRYSLQRLPPGTSIHRFSALENLTRVFLRKGDGDAALCAVLEAHDHCPSFNYQRAYLTWLKGRVLMHRREVAAAEESMRVALSAILEIGEPLDAALATVDLALTLFVAGKRSELGRLLENTHGWMARLKKNARAHGVMTTLLTIGLRGELNERILSGSRLRLEEAGRRVAARQRSSNPKVKSSHKSPDRRHSS